MRLAFHRRHKIIGCRVGGIAGGAVALLAAGGIALTVMAVRGLNLLVTQ